MTKANTTGTSKAAVKGTAHEMEGRKAPPFELPDGSGKTLSLKELLGRGSLVLYFYPKDMTPGCTTEACDFRDITPRLKTAGALVVGISADSPESHSKFTDKHELNFPLLSDSGNRPPPGDVPRTPTWEELARSHGRFLYTVAYRLTGNDADAQDLVQEVLL